MVESTVDGGYHELGRRHGSPLLRIYTVQGLPQVVAITVGEHDSAGHAGDTTRTLVLDVAVVVLRLAEETGRSSHAQRDYRILDIPGGTTHPIKMGILVSRRRELDRIDVTHDPSWECRCSSCGNADVATTCQMPVDPTLLGVAHDGYQSIRHVTTRSERENNVLGNLTPPKRSSLVSHYEGKK
ncbi:MAG TPA: hypothetical protein VJ742_12715 [Nitrososphaera sp.]|nr:hypothetical protein [Nitrososphaera sp.]